MSEKRTKRVIIFSVFLSSAAVIGYEILAGSVLSNLLGSSIYYFSLIIGIFLAALGVGGWLSSRIKEKIFESLVAVEIVIAVLGGLLSVFLFCVYAYLFSFFGALQFSDVFAFLGGIGIAQILFTSISLFFVSCVGILAGFELPLYIRILSEKEILKDAIGKAFLWDYAGALVISVSLPIFFFSKFGLIKTSFLIGTINLIAAIMVFICSDIKNKKYIYFLGFAFVFIINIFGFLWANNIEMFLEKKQFGNREVLYHASSPYQRLTFVEAENKKISFYINGQRQFESGDWDIVYHESFVHPAMSIAKKREDVLILGGGDGLALREILKYQDVKKVTLVDIDPLIIKAASDLDFMRALNKNAFFDSRVNVVVDDAFKFVEWLNKNNTYDLIFIDFPDPTDDSLSRLYSKEFYSLLKSTFRDNTVVVIQSESFFESIQKNILTTLEYVGIQALIYHPPEYDFFDQNFGFSMICLAGCKKDDFKELAVPVSNNIFMKNKLIDIFSPQPIPKYSFYQSEVNSIFHPTIFKLINNVFADHYMQSRPFDDILSQIKTSPEETKKQFIEEFFIMSAISI